ncbi:MAG: apolipoprotein N-acyltransferase [Phycisphaerales bacterium]|nr:apolipoprotein N-acyltransferase [Phycisphaerales bacterium]
MNLWQLVLCAILSAVCTLLSTEPFGFGVAALLAPLLLILIALRATWSWKAFVIVFLTQFPLWLYLQKWTFDITVPGWICFSAYMSIWAPLFVCLLQRVNTKLQFPLYLTAPTVWVGIECLRGLVLFGGYPWYLTGTGMIDTVVVNLATVGSVWLVSFVTVGIASSVLVVRDGKRAIGLCLVFIVLMWIARAPSGSLRPRFCHISVVQSNVPQSNKDRWTYEQQQKDLTSMFQMTLDAVTLEESEHPDLIVWPETMLPGAGFEASKQDFGQWAHQFTPFWIWPEELRFLVRDIDVPMLVGTPSWENITVIEDENTVRVMPEKHYNSAVLLTPEGLTQRYDKMALTPFGEWMPYVDAVPALNKWVRSFAGAAQLADLEAGVEATPLKLTIERDEYSDEWFIGTPICFEVAMPAVVRNLTWKNGKRNADVLVSLSNDGWFGSDTAAKLQHNREARMRCIENQTPMVRAANTGMSSVITAYGGIEYAGDEEMTMEIASVFPTKVRMPRVFDKPLSVDIGDNVAWCSLIASILLIVSSYLKRSSSDVE